MFFNEHGEVSEWSKVLDSKSSVVNSHRGFESHPLCHLQISPCSLQGLFRCPHQGIKRTRPSIGMIWFFLLPYSAALTTSLPS